MTTSAQSLSLLRINTLLGAPTPLMGYLAGHLDCNNRISKSLPQKDQGRINSESGWLVEFHQQSLLAV